MSWASLDVGGSGDPLLVASAAKRDDLWFTDSADFAMAFHAVRRADCCDSDPRARKAALLDSCCSRLFAGDPFCQTFSMQSCLYFCLLLHSVPEHRSS